MSGRGLFISFEGIDGSGKSTQARQLAEGLRDAGHKVVLTREPGGSRGAEEIRALVLEGATDRWSPETELLLFTAARRDHLERVIAPALDAGKVVICDRFTDATMAYQGYARGLPLETIEYLAKLACDGIEPGLTLWLDLPVEVGVKRALQRNDSLNKSKEARFDQESLQFHSRVYQGYAQLHKLNPQRIQRIDADTTPAQVAERVLKVVRQHLGIVS